MSVFGTRPEAIKMSVLIQKMEADAEIQSVVCVTAQHREMLDQVLRPFSIRPDYDLNLMKPGQSLSDITARVLQGLDPILSGKSRISSWSTATRQALSRPPSRRFIIRFRWAM